MDLVPIVMVMGRGEETHGGKGHSDATTSAVCVVVEVNGDLQRTTMAVMGCVGRDDCSDVLEDAEGSGGIYQHQSQ